ncbi:MgtC/SapB family protein [Sphingomonas sp. LaA6.9]|uniref:MgtC/SapB family protein n=1 Tax=Sphingomonas sp. LaA6.9 TaxID=2919914 RepID=UPI001F4F3B83|nr:MgtC/SapB family protein [Sphingomonas sp. LaA6.9]MCJ8157279.1 MgtC/SapB family protein [Sphingomonas sp. LaA6.9]
MLIADSWAELSLRMGLATLVGALLGLDRELRGIDAGIRTNALVSLSSAMVMICSLLLYDQLHALDETNKTDPLRVIQGVAQAIGFIAAGLIFVRRNDVHNVTTAANLWVAAAVGIVAGLGQYKLLAIGTAFAILLLVSEPLFHRLRPDHGDRDTDEPAK